jgi:hypothetical protein
MNKKDSKKYIKLYTALGRLCEKNNLGDPFSYARSKEIYLAIYLKHEVSKTYSGADAFEKNGKPCEYKSTIGKNIEGYYNGISVQKSLKAQKKYIIKEKLGAYSHHYFSRFDGPKLVELYVMDSKTVIKLLLPKIIKKWKTRTTRPTKDPRIGVTMSSSEIHQYGKRLL